ncbi:glycosyltransferase family 4 protein [Vibrio mimicus]
MKNVLFVPGFVCDTWSPIEKYTIDLANELRDECNVIWFVPSIESPSNKFKHEESRFSLSKPLFIDKIKDDNLRLYYYSFSKWDFHKFFYLLKNIIAENKVEYIYVQFGYERYLIPIIAKLLGVKVIYHEHGYPPALKYPRIRKIFYSLCVDSFLTISKFVAKELPPSKPVEVVYNSIDVKEKHEIQEEKKESANLRTTLLSGGYDKIVVMVAAFRDMKRHDLALEVILNVKEKSNLKIKYVFLGVGKLFDFYSSEVERLNLQEDILMPGHVNNVSEYLSAADLSMLTSLAEPFGVSLLESMNYMLPTLSFSSMSANEIIDDGVNGLLIPLGNTEKYAETIIEVLSNETLARTLGENAYEKVSVAFSNPAWRRKIKFSFMEAMK